MYVSNIELLRDEAQRLLHLNIEVLEQMMEAEGVVTETGPDSQQTFDRTSTPKSIEVLKGELTKLDNMELVIAVVGTMKAGKSTTINAIVGTEVLPNRNRPMTALPTLIRHTPGQTDPILKFENNTPINRLFKNIREHIATGTVNSVLKTLTTDNDMKELIDNIISERTFDQHYQGADNIFWCLKTLNDLVRLSSKLEVDFPFTDYDEMHELPVIEVEFTHLKESQQEQQGRLTLLDTPGPNEAGQEHLRKMLTEQLKKSSGILAVFDYSQLKSDADAQVRAELKNIAKLHKGRLFALVNKFDLKDRHGDSAEDVKKRVAEELMDGLIDVGNVFPVSSTLGYLANHAKHKIATSNALPDHNKESWVEDFAEKAFGSSWDADDLSDTDAIKKAADKLWKKSGFSIPVESVIGAAHKQVALLAVDSAAGKLAECSSEIENFLSLREGALTHDINKLMEHISNLKTKIKTIDTMKEKVQEEVNSITNKLKNGTKETIKTIKERCKEKVNNYFKTGKIEEKKRYDLAEKNKVEDKKKNAGILDRLKSSTKIPNKNKQDFNPNEKTIKFDDKEKAKELVTTMQNAVEESIEEGKDHLSEHIDRALDKFCGDFIEEAEKAKAIISKIDEEMNQDGFKISLKKSKMNGLNSIFRNNKLSLSNEIGHASRTETYWVKQDGLLGSLKRLFSDAWGYDERTRQVDEFIVDIEKIQRLSDESVEDVFNNYAETMRKEIIDPLTSEVNDVFKELKKTIERVSGNLQQGIRDKETKDKAELDDLKKCLEQFSSGMPTIKADSEALSHDIDHLKGVKVPA